MALYWDSTYAIVLALLELHPEITPQETGLAELEELVCQLPEFQDDPGLATERILLDIQVNWYEEFTEK